MTYKLLLEICAIFITFFIIGSIACLPIYHWNIPAFFASALWTKIYWWIPIFTGFCAVLFVGLPVAVSLTIALILLAIWESRRPRKPVPAYVWVYLIVVCAGLVHLPLLCTLGSGAQVAVTLISICFASVFSDVVAFFAGTYSGRHHLPAFINPRKSYEGVAGQIIGALLGIALVSLLPEIGFSWPLALGIGTASAAGDIYNSIIKRRLDIKQWGNTIPGHGGVLDRFASLSFALAAGYWITRLLG